MNNIVIINAADISEYALSDIGTGRNSVQSAAETARSMPDVTSKAAIISPDGKGREFLEDFSFHELNDYSVSSLISMLGNISAGFSNIFYFFADCPLIDQKLTERMYENHKKYFSEYTFADGYPAGLSVEIISTSILPALKKLAEGENKRFNRKSLFTVIEKDINTFEIETEISPDDQRLLRVALFPDTRRNFQQLKAMVPLLEKRGAFTAGGSVAGSALDAVRKEGEVLRTLPIFYEIETTSGHPQNISYMPPLAKSGDEMPAELFRQLVGKISSFSDDAVISLSVRNEPSLHSSPAALAEAVLAYDKLELLIETSGTGWAEEEIGKILSLDGSRITWIIDLDALAPDVYESLRGRGRDEAYGFTEKLMAASPDNVYVQAVRMKENELDTEQFFKYWKEKTNNVIIQKYDWCCGRLEQRKVTDLSPIKRLPCWHLKRDMIILLDGTVPICRDDLDLKIVYGNAFSDRLEEIWNKGVSYYKQHLAEEYPGLCLNCDEYYTYNY